MPAIVAHDDPVPQVTEVYHGEPDIHERGGDTEIHRGTFKYVVDGTRATEMNRDYWTDRKTSRRIFLSVRS